MMNITSEYATLPRRLGVTGMRTRVREELGPFRISRVYQMLDGLRGSWGCVSYHLGHKMENIDRF